MTIERGVALSLSTLFEPAVLADPYPFYRQLRTLDPVHWDESWQGWALTSYADVKSALSDARLSAQRLFKKQPSRRLEGAWEPARAVPRAYAQSLLFLDPPDHTRLRALVVKAFTPRVVEELRPRIQRLVDGLLDVAEGNGRMEVIGTLASPLSVGVIAELLGVPLEDHAQFKAWSDDMAPSLDPNHGRPEHGAQAMRAAAPLLDYMAGLITHRRADLRDGLMQALIAASEGDDALSEADVVISCAGLLFAGNETTTNLIGNGLLAFLRHPDQLERLRDDPTLIESTVEEMLRYDSPVQLTARIAKEDVVIGGKRVGVGQRVVLFLGAANRDPAQFAAPDRFDVGRQENHHLSFSHGAHFCLGAALARLEGQIAIGTMLRRLPNLRLEAESLEWRDNKNLRGLRALPVTFG